MSPVAKKNYHLYLRAFFNWMIDQKYIQFDYMRTVKVKRPKREKKPPISVPDLKKLLQATKQSDYAKRDEAALRMLLNTGLRASEWCNIKRSDYDEDNFTIRVLGKGDKFRTVPLTKKTLKSLDLYLRDEDRLAHEPLFMSKQGGALTYAGLYQIIKRTAARAGVKNPGCHAFRRSFIVYMRKGGADIPAIQDLVGHAVIEETAHYALISDADAFGTHQRCSPDATLNI
jgi:integrase